VTLDTVIASASRRVRLLALTAAAGALGCAAPLRTQARAAATPTAEDSVLAAVLEADSVPAGRRLVVRARTFDASHTGPVQSPAAGSRPPGIEPETVEDFWERNEHPREIGPLPGIRVPVAFASEATLDSLPSGAAAGDADVFWRAFYQRFPGARGLVSFSRVGFNAARTQAVVSVSRGCGGLCGTGTLVLLARNPDGRWRVVGSVLMWVS
jgi:hypothetical protein